MNMRLLRPLRGQSGALLDYPLFWPQVASAGSQPTAARGGGAGAWNIALRPVMIFAAASRPIRVEWSQSYTAQRDFGLLAIVLPGVERALALSPSRLTWWTRACRWCRCARWWT